MKLLVKHVVAMVLLTSTLPISAAEQWITSASSDPKEVVSPPGSASPGKRWLQQTFCIKNNSAASYFVHGYNLQSVFVQVYTKDPETQKWVSRELGYCGTGERVHEVRPGVSLEVTVSLPVEISEREFRIEFEVYADRKGTKAEMVVSDTLTMNPKKKRSVKASVKKQVSLEWR